MEALSGEPRPCGVKLLKGEDRYYRMRQGNYRIVYEVDDAAYGVTVIVVGRRGKFADEPKHSHQRQLPYYFSLIVSKAINRK